MSVSDRLAAAVGIGSKAWARTFASALVLLLIVPLLLAGCGKGDFFDVPHAMISLSGAVHGGQQPVGGALIQIYAVGTSGDGSAATPLLTQTVTSSDGTGNASNANANAGNGYNSYPAGDFTLSNAFACPSSTTQIYITGVGGNPGLGAGVINPNLAMMSVLGECGDFGPGSFVSINELTTVASVAPLNGFMTSYKAMGSGSSDASLFLAELNLVAEYGNVGTGSVPGPMLPAGYYASSTEIQTLGDVLATCVNSGGGVAGDGSACGMLFSLVAPSGVTPPTDTIGAMLDIIKYPTNNVCPIFNLATATGPFQPMLSGCPTNWELPIEPIVTTPTISPITGNYVGTQTVTLSDSTAGSTIYYTTGGAIPTTSSTPYTSAFSVSSSTTVKAIAVEAGYANSVVATATYVITPAATPVALAFVQQPSNTATGYNIAPPLSVAVEDSTGNIVTNATNPVTISIGTNPLGTGTLSGTLTATPSNGIATFLTPNIDVIANGYTLVATSGALTMATSTAFNITPYPITITPASNLIGVGSTLPGSFTLSQPAPSAGVTVNLQSTNAAVSIAPASVTLTAGQTVGNFTYTGIATGSVTLSASATNYLTGTSTVTATNSLISLGQLPVVAPGQTSQLALSLGVVAPPGGVTVTLSSSNTGAATVTPSVYVPAGFRIGSQNPQITGVAMGTTTITAIAPGYSPDIRTVNVSLAASFPGSETIPLTAANPVVLTISAPAPVGGVPFTLSSDSPSIASVPMSITVPQGSTTVNVPVTGVLYGTTIIRADSPGVVEATTQVTVQASITMGSVVTGINEYVPANVTLGAVANPPTAVTITSLTPSIALVSASTTAAGSTSITLSNVTNSVPTFYVQGQGTVGTAMFSVSAPGYVTGTGTAVVDPVGIVFYSGATINTTNVSSASTITLATAILDPNTLGILGYNGTPNPGTPAYSIGVTSSNTTVGTITTSPVTFAPGGTGVATTSFNPLAAGTSTISLGTQPTGFTATSSPGSYLSGTATVTANTGVPNINVNVPATGVGLQVPAYFALGAAPESPVNVTLTSTANALLSTSATAPGAASLKFQNVANANSLTFYVQGQAVGTATLTVSAGGYNTSNNTITVDQSGVVFNYGSSTSTFTTTSSSTPTTLTLVTAILDPHTLAIACPNYPPQCGYGLNPGTTASINVNNATQATGTLTGEGLNSFGTVTIGANGSGTTAFTPVNVGTTALTLGTQPGGFAVSTSPGYVSGTATVTGPTINVGSPTTGAGLYVNGAASFQTAPTQPVTVTITSSNPQIATISGSPATVGTQSVTFTNVSGGIPAFYVQGQGVGSATLSIIATGYTTGTSTITVNPSGIVIYEGNSSFTTTNLSSTTTITLATAILDPVSLTVQCGICYYPLNPGTGPLSIAMTSSAPAIGTITNSPVSFPAGSNGAVATAFDPLTAGSTTIALGAQPAGFTASGSSGYLSGTVTVTAPPVYVNINSVTTGVGLYQQGNATLSATTPSPVTVTITSSNPAVALLSTNASSVGSASISFTNVTSSIPPFYVQGQMVGTSSLTASVSGYSTGTATITVDPSGIVFYQGNSNSTFSTTTFSNPTTITLTTTILDPVNLTVLCSICVYPVNPNSSPLSIAVISGTTSVGTIVTTPVVFQPGSNGVATTAFQPVGVGLSALSLGTQPTNFTAASSPGYISGTATVTGPAINVSAVTTGVGLYVNGGASLAVTAPAPVTVTLTSSDPTIATLSTTTSAVGSASISFPNISNSMPAFYVQGQGVGTATLTVSAPGYTTAMVTITTDPSGIVFYQGGSTSTFSTTSFSAPTTLTLVTAILDPKAYTVLCYPCGYPVNPGTGPFSIAVTSTPTSVGTITNGTVTFPAGSNGVASTSFQPVAPGSAVLALGTQPAPFTASASNGYVNGTATVTGPCTIVNAPATGAGFYVSGSASLQVAPPSPVTFTLTSSNPSIALLSTAPGVAGSASISYSNITSSVPTFYVQGQSVGSTIITASAPGYCGGTDTVAVDPPTIVFYNGYAYGTNYTGATFSTTTFSGPSNVALATAILDPTSLAVVGAVYPLNPGTGPLTIGVTSSSTNIGTIPSTATFPAGSNGVLTTPFQPANVGNTTLALGTEPAGFTETSSTSGYVNGTATVTGPTINLSVPTTGAGVYVSANASLNVAPPSAVTVTITSSNPAVALLSSSVNTVGSPSLTFNNITGSVPTFFVQGLTAGTSTVTAVATGYTTQNTTAQVDPIGIVFQNGLSITTTTFSSPTQFGVSNALLDPVTYAVVATNYPFNPNYGPYSITLSSTSTSVGTVTPSVTFAQGGGGVQYASFQPVNAGTTTISLGTQPNGFTTTLSSGTYLNGPATVNGPTINVPNPTTGFGQYVSASASLSIADPSSTTVTITSGSPGTALLSTSANTAGSASVTFNNVTGTTIPVFYVQGQAVGTATLTVAATGYVTGTGTITVDPSGIVFYQGSNSSTLQTTTYSPPTAITLATAILNPGTLSLMSYSGIPNPGTTLSIPVTSSATGVGTVTSPVTFAAGANTATTTFTPVSAGSTNIALGAQPGGWNSTTSTPGYLSGTVTVTAPNVIVSSVTTGYGLTNSGTVSLGTMPPSPVNVTLTSANPAVATLSTTAGGGGSSSITFNGVNNTSALTFYVLGQGVGSAAINVTATGYNGTATMTVDPSALGFTSAPTFSTTALSGNTLLTVTTLVLDPNTLALVASGLPVNAGWPTLSIAVTSSNSAVGTIVTSPVSLGPGASSVPTGFQPVGAGSSTIALGAQPAGFSTPSAAANVQGTATVTSSTINVPSDQTTGVNLTDGNLSVSLGGTPGSAVTITVASSNPAVVTVGAGSTASAVGTGSLPITGVSTTAAQAFNLQGQSVGTAVITISAPGYANATFNVTVDPSGFGFASDPSFSTTPQSANTVLTLYTLVLNQGSLTQVSYNLPLNPGLGSISIPVTSSNTTVGTILTSPVVFTAGAGSVQTSFQPLAGGSSTIAIGAQPAGFSTPSSTADVQGMATVTAPNITVPYGNQITGASLTNTGNLIYLQAAPSAPLTITVTSSDPTIATLNSGSSANAVGTQTITFPNVTAANQYDYFNIQGQGTGMATITISAPGYNTTSITVNVYPSGFGFSGNSQTFSTYTNSANTVLTLYTFILNPGSLTLYNYNQPLNPGLTVSVPVTSSNTSVGTILTNPVVFTGGSTSEQTSFVPAGAGTTTIALAQPTGFTATSQGSEYLTGTATVTTPPLPNITVPYGNQTTGVNLTNTGNLIYLQQAPSAPVTITLTSSNPAIVTLGLGSSASAVGTQTITFNATAANQYDYFNLQGQGQGTATVTISAPGYNTTSITVNVYPSGFGFSGGNATFSTTTFSSPTNLTIFTFVLNPNDLTLSNYNLPVNPGVAPISVPITSSNTSIGTITTSPLVFNPGTGNLQTSFAPAGLAGTSTLSLTQPAGYTQTSQTSSYITGTATVTAPNINVPYGNQTTGVNLTNTGNLVGLSQTPPNPVTITVTISDPTIATLGLGSNATAVGTQTLTFTNISSSSYQSFNIQGQAVGTATVTITAPGFNTTSFTVTVDPSGFGFSGGNMTFNTTTFSSNTNLTVFTFVLNPGSLTLQNYNLPLNPGVGPFSVPVTSSNSAVGTITTSPLMFTSGTGNLQTSFMPTGAGTSTIALSQPAGFTATSQTSSYISGTATVTAPGIALPYGNQSTGVNLTNTGLYVYLTQTPPSAVTVTMTSSNPAVATLGVGQNATAVGTTSIAFTNVSNTGALYFNVQGQSVGTATITVSAPGFATNTFTITVDPSGFGFSGQPNINTTTYSPATNLTLYTMLLSPGTLNEVSQNYPINPGIGPFSVVVTSSNTAVGTITSSPVVFSSGNGAATTNFQPAGTGTSSLAVGAQPAGFSTPAQSGYLQGYATVTAPGIGLPYGNQTTGVNLTDNGLYVYLGIAPPSGVTVTMTSSNPAVVTLDAEQTATVAGTASIAFNNVTGTNGLYFNLQGQSAGTSTITVSAPGFASNTFTVTVDPSAFGFANTVSINTTTTSSPTTLTLSTLVLTPGTLQQATSGLPLNPGVGPLSIVVTSSNTAVGTISTSPVVFAAGASQATTNFTPLAAGGATITIGTQPASFSTPSQSGNVQGSAVVSGP